MGDAIPPFPKGGLDSFMEREILDCLAELTMPKYAAGHKVSSPDVSFTAPSVPDMVMDPINSAQVGSDPEHFLDITPDPAASLAGHHESEVVWDVAITPARPSVEIDATETVVHSASGTDAGFASFLNITKSANSDARRVGSLAASVSHTLGYDGATTQHGSPVALATRITSAKLAAAKGATASAMPTNFDLDVLWARIGNVASAESANADYHSVYLPSDLSPGAMSALLSLLVEGGPGAYTWRYRPIPQGGDPPDPPLPDQRGDYMPAVVRVLHPGGFNQLLAITEGDVLLPPVGGGSLTYAALDALEQHYRSVWGNDTFDAAWRSTFASGAVYLAPVNAVSEYITPGDNFVLRQVTHEHNGNDLQGEPYDWGGPDGPPAPDADIAFPTDALDWGDDAGRDTRKLQQTTWAVCRRVDAALPINFSAALFDGTGARFEYRRPGSRDIDEFQMAWPDIMLNVVGLRPRERRFMQAAMLHSTRMRMPDTLGRERDDEGRALDPATEWRNVFGARDHVKLSLCRLRMFEVVGLIAHYTLPTRRSASHSSLSRADLLGRARNYAAHLHLANFFAYFAKDFWPCDIKVYGRLHSAYMRGVPAALRPYCWMDRIGPTAYQEPNWLLLDAPYLIRGALASDAFVGHNVAGTWPVRTDGLIDLTDPKVNLAAVDAAYRASVNEGGIIAAEGRFGATRFVMVRSSFGLVNPMAFAPRIDNPRGTTGVTLAHDRGPATFMAGANYTVPIVSVR